MTILSHGSEWTFPLLAKYDSEIAKIAVGEFHLDVYPNQVEVISSDQMLDAYALGGLPIGYPHWSYGKEFVKNEEMYRSGMMGLAYEIVINSNPCIAYLMEENSMPIQALVIAHACYGHNSFFKGNYLFRQWTNADAIIDYMVFARRYVLECEERYGEDAVESILDACHALMDYGVDRYRHPKPLSAEEERRRARERLEYDASRYDEIWRTIPKKETAMGFLRTDKEEIYPSEPQENILYFVEKESPKLKPWQRELVRIVRKTAQYFYPQGQTKVMNEGWATFWHYTITNRLHEKRLVDDGFMIEFLKSHTNVILQRAYNERGFGGINPYTLGFAIFSDIRRICETPTPEDREWFPNIVGKDWRVVLDEAMRNHKDESFISQYLSPKVIRDLRLFAIADLEDNREELTVDCIHNTEGYRRVRKLLSLQYNRDDRLPNVQITRYHKNTDRTLELTHVVHRKRELSDESDKVFEMLAALWGFPVKLIAIDEDGDLEYSKTYQPAEI